MNHAEKKRKLKNGFIVLGVVALAGFALILRYGDVNFTNALVKLAKEIQPLRSDAKFISRYGNQFYHFLFTAFLVYGFFGRKNRKKRKYLRVALIYIVVQLIASGVVTQGLKMAVGRPRPTQARREGFDYKPFHRSTRYRSFPSGHSADAFSSAGVIWMFSSSPGVIAVTFAYSAFIALSRILADKHYMLDIISGMIIGFVTALILMYKKYTEGGN